MHMRLPAGLKLLVLSAAIALSNGFQLAVRTTTTHARGSASPLMEFVTHYEELAVPTGRTVSMVDITDLVKGIVTKSQVREGTATVLSKHSTVGVTINEFEGRFVDDARQFFLELCPPTKPWLHNDLDFRVGPPDWPGGDAAWREFRSKEPVNAHSHIIQLLLGTTEAIPIHEGKLTIGTYQNVIVVDADGPAGNLGSPKTRSIVVQVQGSD